MAAAKRFRKLIFCGHCESYLTKSTYYRHRSDYFDIVNQRWTRSCLESGGKSTQQLYIYIEFMIAFVSAGNDFDVNDFMEPLVSENSY